MKYPILLSGIYTTSPSIFFNLTFSISEEVFNNPCENCQQENYQIYCETCFKYLCNKCNSLLHLKGVSRTHVRRVIDLEQIVSTSNIVPVANYTYPRQGIGQMERYLYIYIILILNVNINRMKNLRKFYLRFQLSFIIFKFNGYITLGYYEVL